jgi:hypothetical protein
MMPFVAKYITLDLDNLQKQTLTFIFQQILTLSKSAQKNSTTLSNMSLKTNEN